MKAIVQHRYGSGADLELSAVDEPVVGDGQVLVQVAAAGLDMGVWHAVTGEPYVVRPVLGLRRPKQPIPGSDAAGRVVAVGAGVAGFAVGDEVFGEVDGAFAEHAVTTPDRIVARPANVDPVSAAAVTTSATAALQALRDVGRLRVGQRLLVVGASGGVGSYAVQLGKAFGAHVTGVASTRSLDLVRSLGADEVIDYTRDEIDATGRRWDVVVDVAGRRSVRTLRRAVVPGGTVVFVGGERGGRWTGGIGRWVRGSLLSPLVRERFAVLSSSVRGDDLEVLRDLLAAGEVVPVVDRTYALADAATALADLRAGHVRGKAVLVP